MHSFFSIFACVLAISFGGLFKGCSSAASKETGVLIKSSTRASSKSELMEFGQNAAQEAASQYLKSQFTPTPSSYSNGYNGGYGNGYNGGYGNDYNGGYGNDYNGEYGNGYNGGYGNGYNRGYGGGGYYYDDDDYDY